MARPGHPKGWVIVALVQALRRRRILNFRRPDG